MTNLVLNLNWCINIVMQKVTLEYFKLLFLNMQTYIRTQWRKTEAILFEVA